MSQPSTTVRDISSLAQLQQALHDRSMTPGWIKRDKPFLWPEMKSAFVPAHWRYAAAKDAQFAAGKLIGTDLAERRNFIMTNPIEAHDNSTLRTLVAAYQSILPGEKARSHRHSSHALRVILESKGSYSVVNGQKHPMESGDIVLTPGGCWHGHGHEGTEQAFWFDGLDVPLTHLLEPMFFDEHPDGYEPIVEETPDSPMRFTWSSTQAALADAKSDALGCFGPTITLDAPSIPTMTLRVHSWKAGTRTAGYRHTPNSIFVVMKGRGSSTIGRQTFDWSFGDTIAAPGWQPVQHEAEEDSIVFSMSDEQLMRSIAYYRFEKLDEASSAWTT